MLAAYCAVLTAAQETPSPTGSASHTPTSSDTPSQSLAVAGSATPSSNVTMTSTVSPLIVGVKPMNDAQKGGTYFGLIMGFVGTGLVLIAAYRHLPGPKDGILPPKAMVGDATAAGPGTPALSAASTASSVDSPMSGGGAGTGQASSNLLGNEEAGRRTLQVGVTSTSAYTSNSSGAAVQGGGGGVAFNPLRTAAAAAAAQSNGAAVR